MVLAGAVLRRGDSGLSADAAACAQRNHSDRSQSQQSRFDPGHRYSPCRRFPRLGTASQPWFVRLTRMVTGFNFDLGRV